MRPLRTYDDWKHCITEICKVPLTPDYVAMRLKELRDPRAYNTQKFVSTWGEGHRKQIIAWFEQAETELSKGLPDNSAV